MTLNAYDQLLFFRASRRREKEPMKLNEVRRPGWANPTSQEAQQKAGQPV
jgi:hypothetical protein